MSTETQEQASEGKRRILNLLAQGKITIEEAEQLLDAIQGSQRDVPQQSSRDAQSKADRVDRIDRADSLAPAWAREEEIQAEAGNEREAEDEDEANEALAEAEEAIAEAEEEAREAGEEAAEAAAEAKEIAAELEEERQERDKEKSGWEYEKREQESSKEQSASANSGFSGSKKSGGPSPFGSGVGEPWANFAQIGAYVSETVRAALSNLPQGMSEFVRSRVHDAFETLEARPSMQTTGWQREFRAVEVTKIDVSADNGPIRLRKSDDPFKIRVKVILDPLKALITGEGEAQSRLEGGILFLTASRRTEGFEIEIPEGKPISAFSKNGPLAAEGLRGEMRLATKNGPLNVKQCQGKLDLEAKNGPITTESAEGNIQILGKNGPIRVQGCKGFLRVETKNGPLAVHDHEGYPSVSNTNGPISISGILEKIKVEQGNGPVRVDLSRSIKIIGSIASVNGPATVVLGDHCAVRLTCRTSRGPVVRNRQLDIEEEGRHLLRAARGEAEGELIVTNENGAVIIE